MDSADLMVGVDPTPARKGGKKRASRPEQHHSMLPEPVPVYNQQLFLSRATRQHGALAVVKHHYEDIVPVDPAGLLMGKSIRTQPVSEDLLERMALMKSFHDATGECRPTSSLIAGYIESVTAIPLIGVNFGATYPTTQVFEGRQHESKVDLLALQYAVPTAPAIIKGVTLGEMSISMKIKQLDMFGVENAWYVGVSSEMPCSRDIQNFSLELGTSLQPLKSMRKLVTKEDGSTRATHISSEKVDKNTIVLSDSGFRRIKMFTNSWIGWKAVKVFRTKHEVGLPVLWTKNKPDNSVQTQEYEKYREEDRDELHFNTEVGTIEAMSNIIDDFLKKHKDVDVIIWLQGMLEGHNPEEQRKAFQKKDGIMRMRCQPHDGDDREGYYLRGSRYPFDNTECADIVKHVCDGWVVVKNTPALVADFRMELVTRQKFLAEILHIKAAQTDYWSREPGSHTSMRLTGAPFDSRIHSLPCIFWRNSNFPLSYELPSDLPQVFPSPRVGFPPRSESLEFPGDTFGAFDGLGKLLSSSETRRTVYMNYSSLMCALHPADSSQPASTDSNAMSRDPFDYMFVWEALGHNKFRILATGASTDQKKVRSYVGPRFDNMNLFIVENPQLFNGAGSRVAVSHTIFGVGRHPLEQLEQAFDKGNDGTVISGHMIGALLAHPAHFVHYLYEIMDNLLSEDSIYLIPFNEPKEGSGKYHAIDDYFNALALMSDYLKTRDPSVMSDSFAKQVHMKLVAAGDLLTYADIYI